MKNQFGWKMLLFVKRSYGEFCIETFRERRITISNTNPPCYIKFWNEKLISISYVAFRHENRSFGEFCFDRWEWRFQADTRKLRWILPRKFDFDQNCNFSTLKMLLLQIWKQTEIWYPTKNLANYVKFWYEKMIFIKIVNFSTQKSLLRRIGHRNWNQRDDI